jgi:hypothetical protein
MQVTWDSTPGGLKEYCRCHELMPLDYWAVTGSLPHCTPLTVNRKAGQLVYASLQLIPGCCLRDGVQLRLLLIQRQCDRNIYKSSEERDTHAEIEADTESHMKVAVMSISLHQA